MDVIMPQLGETVEEGTVAAWHKKEGDKVAIDELLVEIETDKVATEVPSLVAGTLRKILVGKGETVKVGTTLAIIDSGDGAAAAPAAAGIPTASALRASRARPCRWRKGPPLRQAGTAQARAFRPRYESSFPNVAWISGRSRAPDVTAASSAATFCLICKTNKAWVPG